MQRIYGFVQEEDGVVPRLLTEISAYFEYLARQHGDYVAFHNVKIRVQNAKQLLRGTGLSISQIADALGICNANYFCQIFKEDTGLTPSDYRRNCYEKENTKPSVL